jgi:hypothetical protein
VRTAHEGLRVCVRTRRETAGPSTTLRFGRDDNFVAWKRLQPRLLHGKGSNRVCCMEKAPTAFVAWKGSNRVCCMEKVPTAFVAWKRLQPRLLHGKGSNRVCCMEKAPTAVRRMAVNGPTELSSRPERSVVEGPAVSLPGLHRLRRPHLSLLWHGSSRSLRRDRLRQPS